MKKIILLLSATVFLISCNKTKFSISGTAKGIENGKTIIMETRDSTGMGMIAVDTVKVENGKFEISGKAIEPNFHTLSVEGINGKFLFILENGDIEISIDKDSIHKSKVSGTYNNDEFAKFNEELTKIQKGIMNFQKKNTPLMSQAQQANDTVVINKLMKEYGKLQEVATTKSKKIYKEYPETHPKSFISVLLIEGMAADPLMDIKNIDKLFSSLDESLKTTKPGKAIAEKIKAAKSPSVNTGPTSPVGTSK